MSAYTKEWTTERIREVFARMDQKTGLSGASVPIKIGNSEHRLGYYQGNGPAPCFGFSALFLNDPEFKESEAIQLLRHEYAHYYVHETRLYKWIPRGRAVHHGPDWRFACGMVGAVPQVKYKDDKTLPEISKEHARRMMKAEDVRECRIQEFLKRWDRIPLSEQESEFRNLLLKKHFTDSAYYEIGDECFHRKKGFGKVLDTYPEPEMQWLYVKYEDGTEAREHFLNVFKISNGVIMASRYELDAIHFSWKER